MTDENQAGKPESGGQGQPPGDTQTPDPPAQPSTPVLGVENGGQQGAEKAEAAKQSITSDQQSLIERMQLTDWIMAIATVIITVATIWNVVFVGGQLHEMQTGGIDTHNLAVAATEQAKATNSLSDATHSLLSAGQDQATAAKSEATAMDKLRLAGEAQAKASAALAAAGQSQAESTRSLASATGNQLAAVQAQADAARTQAVAVGKSADAAIIASKATDRLANAGQAQSQAVLQSLDVARRANDIATAAAAEAVRPWVSLTPPPGAPAAPKANTDFRVDIGASNGGHSPALHAKFNATLDVYSVATLNVPVVQPCAAIQCQQYTIFPGTMFGNDSLTFHARIPADKLTSEEIERINNGVDVIVLMARNDYHDDVGHQHYTVICYIWAPKLLETGAFTACDTDNEAD